MTDICSATFTFYSSVTKKVNNKKVEIITERKVENIVCKYIPLRFLINEGVAYKRAIRSFSDSFLKELITDKATGLKRFKVDYLKKIGETNN